MTAGHPSRGTASVRGLARAPQPRWMPKAKRTREAHKDRGLACGYYSDRSRAFPTATSRTAAQSIVASTNEPEKGRSGDGLASGHGSIGVTLRRQLRLGDIRERDVSASDE